MLIRFLIISIAVIVTSCLPEQKGIDEKACKLYLDHLSKIETSLREDSGSIKINSSIEFLENVTKIKSQSDGNYFGRFDPTLKDLEKWSEWYETNKLRLKWDESSGEIIVIN